MPTPPSDQTTVRESRTTRGRSVRRRRSGGGGDAAEFPPVAGAAEFSPTV
ncbi:MULTISPECIES: hypothetical protein [Acetobacter]|nr:hypothetical protein [Acetobacter pasteurianus]